jgi:hypothetical protein
LNIGRAVNEQSTDGNERCNRRERFKVVDTEYLREVFSN